MMEELGESLLSKFTNDNGDYSFSIEATAFIAIKIVLINSNYN